MASSRLALGAAPSDLCVIAREVARQHRLWHIPFIGVPWAAIRDSPPQRARTGRGAGALPTAQHLPHMAQLTDFMRFQVHADISAIAVHADISAIAVHA